MIPNSKAIHLSELISPVGSNDFEENKITQFFFLFVHYNKDILRHL